MRDDTALGEIMRERSKPSSIGFSDNTLSCHNQTMIIHPREPDYLWCTVCNKKVIPVKEDTTQRLTPKKGGKPKTFIYSLPRKEMLADRDDREDLIKEILRFNPTASRDSIVVD